MEDQTINENITNDPKASNYPIPLSPPLPAISKQIELNRAMSASSLSSLFSLSSRDVVFEDEWLIVVNKPQGVYCENVLSSIPSLLMNSTDLTIPIDERKPPELHLANRLDRDTSGLMVITKSHKVAGKLVKAFTEHKIRKTYIALCIGSAPKWERISIKSGHGRSKFGVWRVYAASDVGRTLPGGSAVRAMATTFEVLSVNGQGGFKEQTKSRPNEEEYVVIEDKGVALSFEHHCLQVDTTPSDTASHGFCIHMIYNGVENREDLNHGLIIIINGEILYYKLLLASGLSIEDCVEGDDYLIEASLVSNHKQSLSTTL
ncbi:Rna pseudouridine synthase [Thalictrum thalictroides]|uniref:Rna pseudouridine synthase n=1 Tax=Thalictrum thalictroides TaxID=46969 RepID=A0A7J6WRW9_THATH|nr:Rna pseudouridine synthase [Thalictrum thalictroides]